MTCLACACPNYAHAVCAVSSVSHVVCGECVRVQWPGRGGAGRRAFTSGHVLPCAVFSAPRAVLSVLTVEFRLLSSVVVLSLLSSEECVVC